MYRCSWIINNKQCSNLTSKIVCNVCEPEKANLYHKYKETEKTVISAINSAPRGDIIEASKVIGRITKVIELRREFTNRLTIQERDIGHEYHISKLLGIIEEYRAYVQKITTDNITISNSDVDINISSEEHMKEQTFDLLKETNNVRESMMKITEEDPFKDFDDDIKAYRKQQKYHNILLNQLGNLLGYKGADLCMILYYHDMILATCKGSLVSMKSLISGHVLFASSKPAFSNYTSPQIKHTLDMFRSMNKYGRASWNLFHDWILKRPNMNITIITHLSKSQKALMATMYLGPFRIGEYKGLCPYIFGIESKYVEGNLTVGLKLGVLPERISSEGSEIIEKLNILMKETKEINH